MIIDGDFTVNAPIEKVWNFLIDFEQVSLCMPGVSKVEPVAENTFNGVVTVKVGPISTSFPDFPLHNTQKKSFLLSWKHLATMQIIESNPIIASKGGGARRS